MMKAARIHDDGPPEVLCCEDAPTSEPGPREVRCQGSCERQSVPAVTSAETACAGYSSSKKENYHAKPK